ncbi:MAG: hypothetical protein EOO39_29145, partial [Cytophagaceae bacterium]
MMFVVPLLIGGMTKLIAYVAKDTDQVSKPQTVKVIDESHLFEGKLKNAKNIQFVPTDETVDKAKKGLADNEDLSILLISKDYVHKPVQVLSKKKPSFALTGEVENQMNEIASTNTMLANHIDTALINKAQKSKVEVSAMEVTEAGTKDANVGASMGVGIAAVGLMVLYVWHELSYDRFNANADRIFRVVHYAQWAGGNLQLAPTSAPFAGALKNDYPEIEKAVRLYPEGGGLITYRDKKIETNDVMFADQSVFDVFTFPFLYGDPATALAQPERIVITKTLAEKLFGDASKAVGQPIEFSNHFVNIVTGVIADVPTNSHLKFSALRSMPTNYTNGWQSFDLYTYVLLNKAADAKALEAKLAGFYPKYLKKEMGADVTYRMELQPLPSIHLHSHLDYEAGANGNSQTVYI